MPMTLLCIFMDIKGDKSSMLNKLQSLFTTRKKLLRLLLVIGIIGIGASIPILSRYEWSGFGKDSNKSESVEETIKDGKVISTKKTTTEHFQSAKTLWDWLGLGGTIAIPVMIYLFQAGEQRRADKRANAEKEAADKRAKAEKEIADGNLREEALQAYIDRMAEILIDKDRRSELLPDKNNSNSTDTNNTVQSELLPYKSNNNDTSTDNPVRDVARVRTTTILRRLEGDEERQGHVLDFLRDSELLNFILSGAKLRGANLSRAILSGANLSDAYLSRANLSGANLMGINLSRAYLYNANISRAYLNDANLSHACLSDANLSYVDLSHVDLSYVDLSSANLSGANLKDANLRDANLRGTNLSRAYLSDANLSRAYLSDADLSGAYLINVKNLTIGQIKAAKEWETAKYDPEFRSLLGLPPETPQNSGADIQK
ncbi:hypothetical protein CAL7716_057180 [Calothrix sp. PCC 7716]|nr:hypothetical protein CAL7716_057180 [Calothrix sp. PCC 7716]